MDGNKATGGRIVPVNLGRRTLRLVAPDDPDRLLSDPAVLERNRQEDYMPYWAYLWPGAFLLAAAVMEEPAWESAGEVLEIGCGLGLAGLATLAAGAPRVVFSDYDPTTLEFVARSARENGFAPERWATRQMDWRDPPAERYGVLLGADVLYERRLVPLVTGVIDRMLAPGGLALVAGPYRVATEDLPGSLAERGLTATTRALRATDPSGRPVSGTLHRIRHQANSTARLSLSESGSDLVNSG